MNNIKKESESEMKPEIIVFGRGLNQVVSHTDKETLMKLIEKTNPEYSRIGYDYTNRQPMLYSICQEKGMYYIDGEYIVKKVILN